MATVAVPRSSRRLELKAPDAVIAGVVLVVLTVFSIYVRTRAIGGSFWMDEGLSVGIASHPLTDIPGVLHHDGSPPFYYMLLHVWMDVAGRSETAVHWLSLIFSLLTIPVGMWAGWSLWGRRAGYIVAVLCAANPFLTAYGEEARMYSLMTFLGLIATASFVHAFIYGRRRYIVPFVIAMTGVIYTHNWGLFYGIATFVALIPIYRRTEDKRRLLVDVALAFGIPALLYLPWLPTLLFQSAHTAAPWGTAPRAGAVIQISRQVMGGDRAGIVLLLIGGYGLVTVFARGTVDRVREGERRAIVTMLIMAIVTLLIGWVLSQFTPAWVARYFAPIVGALLLLSALGLARAGWLGLVGVFVVFVFWFNPKPFVDGYKSDMRDIGAGVGSLMQPGDLVIVGQPEQTPLAWYYMPGGLTYANTIGPVSDPRYMDWVDAEKRWEAEVPSAVVPPMLAKLRPGQKVLFIRPLTDGIGGWKAPWTSLARRRSAQYGAILANDPQLKPVKTAPLYYRGASTVGDSAVVYEKTAAPTQP
jgi:mannosyltransferase